MKWLRRLLSREWHPSVGDGAASVQQSDVQVLDYLARRSFEGASVQASLKQFLRRLPDEALDQVEHHLNGVNAPDSFWHILQHELPLRRRRAAPEFRTYRPPTSKPSADTAPSDPIAPAPEPRAMRVHVASKGAATSKAELPLVVCDRCSNHISKGDGYAFYSSAQVSGRTVGNMLLCDACTAAVITDDMFGKRFAPTAVRAGDEVAMREATNAATAAGIAERCRAHGFAPDQAKAKARELATRFWNDLANGGQAVRAFWTSAGAQPPSVPASPRQTAPVAGTPDDFSRPAGWDIEASLAYLFIAAAYRPGTAGFPEVREALTGYQIPGDTLSAQLQLAERWAATNAPSHDQHEQVRYLLTARMDAEVLMGTQPTEVLRATLDHMRKLAEVRHCDEIRDMKEAVLAMCRKLWDL